MQIDTAPDDGNRLEYAMPRLMREDGTIVERLSRTDGQRTVLGRCEPSDLMFEFDPHISAVHACITWVAALDAHVLHDCGSANGTLLNDVPLFQPRQLQHGSHIRIGVTELIYSRDVVEPEIIRRSRSTFSMDLV